MSVTLSGTFLNPDGSNIGTGTLILTLSQSAVETGTGWVVPSVVRVSLTNGAIPGATTVLGNDVLTPSGTVYSASILTSAGFSWNLGSFSITGSSFNFNDAVPVSQSLIFPPTTLAIKPATSDGIQFVSANGNDSNDGLSWGTAKLTIQAANTTLATSGGTIFVSASTIILASTVTLNTGVSIVGTGWQSVLSVTHTNDAIVTAPNSQIRNLQIVVGTTASRSGSALIRQGGIVNLVENVRFVADLASANNGMAIASTYTGGAFSLGQLFIRDTIIDCAGGGKWTNALLVSSSSTYIGNVRVFNMQLENGGGSNGGGIFTDAPVVIDGSVDAPIIEYANFALASGSGGSCYNVRNTVGNPPHMVFFHNCFAESDGYALGFTGLKIDAGTDVQYVGGDLSGLLVGAAINGASANSTTISRVIFESIGESAITYTGTLQAIISENWFKSTGLSAANTYDTIAIAADSQGFIITDNIWLNATGTPRYGISIATGVSNNFSITGNVYGDLDVSFGTGFLLNGATGTQIELILQSGGTELYGTTFVASQTVPTAASGVLRLATTDTIAWRNNANSGDVALSKNTSDQLTAGAMALTGEFACNGATPVAATTGYGTPTGNALTASFAASTITLPELAAELAQLILDLKAAGLIKA